MLSSSSSEIDKSTVNGFIFWLVRVRLMTFVVDIVLVSCCYVQEFFPTVLRL